MRASNLLRRDFCLADPICFVGTKAANLGSDGGATDGQNGAASPTNGSATSNTSVAPQYKYITEAYRNKLDTEFAPLHFALPMDLPKEAKSAVIVDFVSSTAVEDGSGAAVNSSNTKAKKERLMKSLLFPSNVLPPVPAPAVTLADMQTEQQQQYNNVSTMHRFGDDALWPYIQPSETLTFEMVDANFDANKRDTLPSLIGAATVPVSELLLLEKRCAAMSAIATQRLQQQQQQQTVPALHVSPPPQPPTGGARRPSGALTSPPPSPAVTNMRAEAMASRFVLTTNLPGNVNITPATPASTVERLRQRQKRRFPVPLSRFVFSTLAEATVQDNAQMLNRANSTRSAEITVLNVSKRLRPSFLSFVQGGQWDLSSLIAVDCTHNALWSHFNSFLPNDMPDAQGISKSGSSDGGANPSKGKNVYETIIVAINKLLVPFLTRGGSDVLAITTSGGGNNAVWSEDAPMPVSISTMHTHPEGFGVHVDETSITSRKIDPSTAFSADESPFPPQRLRRSSSVTSSFADDVADDVSTGGDMDGREIYDAAPMVPVTAGGRSLQHVFSAIRDWGGDGSLTAYKSKFEGVVVKARAAAGMPAVNLDGVDRALQELLKDEGVGAGAGDGSGSAARKVQTTRSALQPPPPSKVPRGPISLCAVMKRCMLRCVALSQARKQTAARVDQMQEEMLLHHSRHTSTSHTSPFGRQVFHVITIVIHSDVSDAIECATLLSKWQTRPVFFIFIFLDEPAPNVLCGIPNCVTVDMSCCSKSQQLESRGSGPGASVPEVSLSTSHRGSRPRPSVSPGNASQPCLENYEMPLLAVHRQLRSLEFAVGRIPLAFLSFTRVAGVQPMVQESTDNSPPKLRSGSRAPTTEDVAMSTNHSGQATTSHASEMTPSVVRRLSRSIAEDQRDIAAQAQHDHFVSAREKFLTAFNFKAKAAPTSEAESKRPLAMASPLVATTTAPILTSGAPNGASDSASQGALRPTFTGEVLQDAASAVNNVSAVDGTALVVAEANAVAIPQPPAPPKDLRAAAVALFDVFMDDEQLKEWEVDPQHLRVKMQSVALQHKAPSPAGTTAANERDTPGPLIDDSLIRLHLKRIQSMSGSTPTANTSKHQRLPSPTSPNMIEDDIDETPHLSDRQQDPSQPVRVFLRKTKQDGHLKEVGLRIGSVESFAAKLPTPPAQPSSTKRTPQSNGASSAQARNANRRVSESPFSAASLEKRMLESARAAAAGEAPDPDAPQRPLTARQMAEKREQEETERAVNWALRKLLKKTGQHLKRPHIHNRILQSNQNLQKRRQSLQHDSLMGDDGDRDDASQSSFNSGSSRRRTTSHSGFEFGDPDEDDERLEDQATLFGEYRGSQAMKGLFHHHMRLVNDALTRKEDAARGYPIRQRRPSTAGSAGSYSTGGTISSARISSAYTSNVKSRTSATNAKGGNTGSTTAADEDEEDDVRFQQLTSEKRMKLQQLSTSDARSFGGPRINEELIFEQEAEFDRRRMREHRKRETERIEEAYRAQKQKEMFEKNRSKVKQFIENTSVATKDETANSDVL